MIDPARLETFAEAFTDALMQAVADVQPSIPAGQSPEQYVLDGALRMIEQIERGGTKSIEHYVLNTRGVSILKTKYDTMQAITYRPQWMIDRWYEQLIRDAKRMIAAWESGYWDWNLDHACAEYGGCPFRGVCQMKDPEQLLAAQFEQRRWDPVSRVETVL